MRILLVTPLYPPDIVETAVYMKELAMRLSKIHTITILAYGHLPEQIKNVRIIGIEKRDGLLVRITHFTQVLIREMQQADIVFCVNGPSVELPLFIAHLFRKTKVFFLLGDETALTHARTSLLHKIIFRLACVSAHKILVYSDNKTAPQKKSLVPVPHLTSRPEILPFQDFPEDAMKQYSLSWEQHITSLTKLFTTP
jgi:hypothetical protein